MIILQSIVRIFFNQNKSNMISFPVYAVAGQPVVISKICCTSASDMNNMSITHQARRNCFLHIFANLLDYVLFSILSMYFCYTEHCRRLRLVDWTKSVEKGKSWDMIHTLFRCAFGCWRMWNEGENKGRMLKRALTKV